MEATCPDITFWRTYCDGSSTPDERHKAENHLARCQRCRQRLISFYDSARETRFEPAPDFLRTRALKMAPEKEKWSFFASFRLFAPVAVAVALLLVVGVSFMILRDRNATTPTSDLRQSNGTSNQVNITNPPNGSQLESGAVDFRWEVLMSDARYEFTLTDEKGDIIFHQRNAKAPLRVDTAALKLSPQQKYYWSVTATLPDGTRRESPISSFTIK
jgi:hypothetical protein